MADEPIDNNQETTKAEDILQNSNPYGNVPINQSSDLPSLNLPGPDPAAYLKGDFRGSLTQTNPLDYLPNLARPQAEGEKNELSTQEDRINFLYNSGIGAAEEVRDNNFMGREHYFGSGLDHHQFERYHSSWDYDKFGFSPFRDNEALYNANTNFAKEMYRAIPQFQNLYRLGFVDALTFGDATDSSTASEFEKAMAIGQSSVGGVSGFTSNLMLNAGYTVGIMNELVAEEALMAVGGFFTGGTAWGVGVARGARGAAKIWKGAKTAGKILSKLDNLKNANKARSLFTSAKAMGSGALQFVNPLDEIVDFAKNYDKLDNIGKLAKVSKGFGSFYRNVRNIRLAYGESALEGGMVQNEVSKNLYDEFVKENGRPPTKEEALKIADTAQAAGLTTFYQNFPTIFYSNKIVFDNLFKGMSGLRALARGPIKTMGGKIIQTGAKESPFEIAQKGIKGLWQSAKNPAAYAKYGANYFKANFAEGLQETAQEVIGGWTSDYYEDLYRGNTTRGAYYSYIGDNLYKQVSAQGFETFMSGFLMGGLVQGPQKLAVKARQNLTERVKLGKEGYAAAKARRKESTEEIKNQLNDMYNDVNKYFAPDLENLVAQNKYNEGISKAARKGNRKAYMDLKLASESEHVLTALRMGRLDSFIDQLKSQKDLTEEEIQADARYKGMTKAEFDAGIDSAIDRAKQIEERYKLIEKKFPNPVDPSKYKGKMKVLAELDYKAWEDAKKQAVFMQSSFDNTLSRMNSILNNAKNDAQLKNTPLSDFNVLFKQSDIQTELDTLKTEIESLEGSTAPESIKAEQRAKRKKELLENYLEALQDYNAVEISEELEKALTEAGPAKKAQLEYDEFFKRPAEVAADDAVLSAEEEAVQKLYDAYEAYLKDIAETNDDYVFDESIQKAFQQIIDFNQLSKESKIITDSINALLNPGGYLEQVERNKEILRLKYENRKAEIAASYDEYQKMMDFNDMLRGLHDLGMFFDPEQAYELLDKGVLPSEFFYANTLQPVVPLNEDGTENEDYIKAVNFVEEWVGEVMNMPIPERKGSIWNTKARDKFDDDKRTYDDLAKQFGFDTKSKVSLPEVLQAIIESDYATDSEKALAERLKEIASDEETVTFSKKESTPGSYSETTQTVIDARYSSENYDGGNTPIEHVILHEEIHRRTVAELEKDSAFKNDISDLLLKAREYFNQDDVKEKWGDRLLYGLKNEAEFIAEAMSSEQFQTFLAEIKYDGKVATGWSTFIGAVLKMLKGVFGRNVDNTVLNAAIGVITNKIDKTYGELTETEVTPEGIEAEATAGDYARVAALAKKMVEGGDATTTQELEDVENYPNLLDEYVRIEEERKEALNRASKPSIEKNEKRNALKEKVKADIDARFAKIEEIKIDDSLSESNTVKAILKEIAEIVNSVYEYEQDPLSIEDVFAEEKGIAQNEVNKLEERGYELSMPGILGRTLTPAIDVTVTKVNSPFVLSDQPEQKKIISKIVAFGISLDGSVIQEPQVEVTVEIKSKEEMEEALLDLKAEKEALENIGQPTWQEDVDIETLEKALKEVPAETEDVAEPTVDTEAINKEFDKKIAAVKPAPVEKKTIKEAPKRVKIRNTVPISILVNEHSILARDLLQAYKNEESKRGAEGQADNLNPRWAELSDDQILNSPAFRNWFKNFSAAKTILDEYNEKTGRTIDGAPPKAKKTKKTPTTGVRIITTPMRNALKNLGYLHQEINEMGVDEAQDLIDDNITKSEREAMDLAAAQTQAAEKQEQKLKVRGEIEDLVNSANTIEELDAAEIELHNIMLDPNLREIGEIDSDYIQQVVAAKKERMAFDFEFDDFVAGEVFIMNDRFGTKAKVDNITGNTIYAHKLNDPTVFYRISRNTLKNRIKYKYSPLAAEVGVTTTEVEATEEEKELSNEAVTEVMNTPENAKELLEIAQTDAESGWLDNINECG